MILTVNIKDKDKRIQFAAEIKNLIRTSKDYIPSNSKKIIKSDIGIKATVTQEELAQVIALIERRGYTFNKQESPDKSGDSALLDNNHISEQKTT
ncbi:MAG: hypothetical protein CMC15_16465 [Flavobacteriaceae bacterium]|nr:hypothetical protein [Flavobacteriaceae bacterium]